MTTNRHQDTTNTRRPGGLPCRHCGESVEYSRGLTMWLHTSPNERTRGHLAEVSMTNLSRHANAL